jgi:hypothetical protein
MSEFFRTERLLRDEQGGDFLGFSGSREFVSREEELVALAMSELGWEWEYEVHRFTVSNGIVKVSVTPDFKARTKKGRVVYVEVKRSPQRRGKGKKGKRHKRQRLVARYAGLDFAYVFCLPTSSWRLKRRLRRAEHVAGKAGRKARRHQPVGWTISEHAVQRSVRFLPGQKKQAG